MDSGVKTTEELRDYFRRANMDAVDVIEKAIVIAAADQPEKFVAMSGPLIAMIFRCSRSCTDTNNFDVDDSSHESSSNNEEKNDGSRSNAPSPTYDSKQEKEDNVMKEEQDKVVEQEAGDVEVARKVLKINRIISKQNMSDRNLLELLRILRWTPMTVAILDTTKIGMTVNKLKKHKCKDISRMASVMCTNWRSVADEWRLASFAAGIIPNLKNVNLVLPMDDVKDGDDGDDEVQEFERMPPFKIKLKARRVTEPQEKEAQMEDKPQKIKLTQQKIEDEKKPIIMSRPLEQDKLKEPISSKDACIQKTELPLLKGVQEKLIPLKNVASVQKKELLQHKVEENKSIPSKDKFNKSIPTKDVAATVQKKEILPQQKAEEKKLILSKDVCVQRKELAQKKIEEKKLIPSKDKLNKSIPSKDVSIQKKELAQQKVEEKKSIPSKDKLHPDENQMKDMKAAAKRKLQEGYQMEANKKRKIITVTNFKNLPNEGLIPCSNSRKHWKQKTEQRRIGTYVGRI